MSVIGELGNHIDGNFVSYSQRSNGWYKSRRFASTIAIKQCKSCGQVNTFNASKKCRACGSKDVKRVGSLPSYHRQTKKSGVYYLYTPHKINKTPKNASRDIPQKPCSKCGHLTIISSGNVCTPCRQQHQKDYDKKRDATIYRQCSKRTRNANRAARNYGLSDMLTTDEIYTLYKSCNGQSQYTGQSIDVSNFALEHNTPLCKGGSNTIDNIRICTQHENQVKGKMSPKQWHGWLHANGYCQCDELPIQRELI
jgi:hypothetical protein